SRRNFSNTKVSVDESACTRWLCPRFGITTHFRTILNFLALFRGAPTPPRVQSRPIQHEGRTTKMKRVGLWALGIGALVSVGPLTAERGSADENDGAKKCSVGHSGRPVSVRANWNLVSPRSWGNTGVVGSSRRISHILWRRHGDNYSDNQHQRRGNSC